MLFICAIVTLVMSCNALYEDIYDGENSGLSLDGFCEGCHELVTVLLSGISIGIHAIQVCAALVLALECIKTT